MQYNKIQYLCLTGQCDKTTVKYSLQYLTSSSYYAIFFCKNEQIPRVKVYL